MGRKNWSWQKKEAPDVRPAEKVAASKAQNARMDKEFAEQKARRERMEKLFVCAEALAQKRNPTVGEMEEIADEQGSERHAEMVIGKLLERHDREEEAYRRREKAIRDLLEAETAEQAQEPQEPATLQTQKMRRGRLGKGRQRANRRKNVKS